MADELGQNRTAILARMVSNAPNKKLGRTQVMKLFYFLQELKGVSLGYDFRLFTYGPFDSEVLSDLSTACSLDTVSEKTVIHSKGYGYEITLGSRADELIGALAETDPRLADDVDEIVREFGSFGAAELELRSTILFVDREFATAGKHLPDGDLVKRVESIKPHFDKATIQQRVAEMASKLWLKSLI